MPFRRLTSKSLIGSLEIPNAWRPVVPQYFWEISCWVSALIKFPVWWGKGPAKVRDAILSIVLRELDLSLWGQGGLHFRKISSVTGCRLVGEDKRRVRGVPVLYSRFSLVIYFVHISLVYICPIPISRFISVLCGNLSESHSVMSDSLRPHGLYSEWDSPGQNTGVGSLSLLQGLFATQGLNPGLPHCRRIFTHWATREAHSDLNEKEIPPPKGDICICIANSLCCTAETNTTL